jgi:hypothetical protein
MGTGPGPTVIGHFKSAEEARLCVFDLRRAGFREDEVGFSAPTGGPAVVRVLAGERWADARLIMARDDSARAKTSRRSPIREAVERMFRHRFRVEPVGEVPQDGSHPHRES